MSAITSAAPSAAMVNDTVIGDVGRGAQSMSVPLISSDQLLVTSGAHMRRALALFEQQGLQVTAAAADHQIPKFDDPYIPGWVPTYTRLARSSRAIHEWVGYWAYDNTGKL